MNTIQTQCDSCRGTGLYQGMAEPAGAAVVCLTCNGTGCKPISYTPFCGRQRRSDVKTVSLSRGTSILACGAGGKPITYEQFWQGQMPTP